VTGPSEDVIEGSLSSIADALPNGFHDAELSTFAIRWREEIAELAGVAWVARDGPPEVYRPFRLTVEGIRTLTVPAVAPRRERGNRLTIALQRPVRVDGIAGWPPDRTPENPPFPEAWVYSFFVTEWNDFVTIQAHHARLQWVGPAKGE